MSRNSERLENFRILNEEATKLGMTQAQITCMKNIMVAESDGNARECAKTSSAKGLFQIIDDSWNTYTKRLGITGGDRFDPRANCQVMAEIVKDNSQFLEDVLHRAPTAGELYLSHFAGRTGAKKILTASSGTPLADVLSPQAMSANAVMKFRGKKLADWTVEDAEAWASAKMGVNIAKREEYQVRHDAKVTTKDEDEKELAERTRILKDFGMPEGLAKVIPMDSLLGQIFFALLKMFAGDAQTPGERSDAPDVDATKTATQNLPVKPRTPEKTPG